MQIRVADYATGHNVSGKRLVARSLITLLDVILPLTIINFCFVIFSRNRRHLYDRICGAIVLRRSSPPVRSQQPRPGFARRGRRFVLQVYRGLFP